MIQVSQHLYGYLRLPVIFKIATWYAFIKLTCGIFDRGPERQELALFFLDILGRKSCSEKWSNLPTVTRLGVGSRVRARLKVCHQVWSAQPLACPASEGAAWLFPHHPSANPHLQCLADRASTGSHHFRNIILSPASFQDSFFFFFFF